VGLAGAGRVGGGAAAFRCRAEAGLSEPALQGAFAGQLGRGVVPGEEDADETGAPSRVFPAQGEGVVAQLLDAGGARVGAAVVGRRERGVSLEAPAAQELADGTRHEAEGLGNGGDGLAALVAPQDGLPEREGSRCWHGESSRGVQEGCGTG